MFVFVHAQGVKTVPTGKGVKKWQNSVHVVVECPLIVHLFRNNQTFIFEFITEAERKAAFFCQNAEVC